MTETTVSSGFVFHVWHIDGTSEGKRAAGTKFLMTFLFQFIFVIIIVYVWGISWTEGRKTFAEIKVASFWTPYSTLNALQGDMFKHIYLWNLEPKSAKVVSLQICFTIIV